MNVYAELLELLSPRQSNPSPGLIGTIASVQPLTITVGGTALTDGLYLPYGSTFSSEHVGREVALLPLEDGFAVVSEVEAV